MDEEFATLAYGSTGKKLQAEAEPSSGANVLDDGDWWPSEGGQMWRQKREELGLGGIPQMAEYLPEVDPPEHPAWDNQQDQYIADTTNPYDALCRLEPNNNWS